MDEGNEEWLTAPQLVKPDDQLELTEQVRQDMHAHVHVHIQCILLKHFILISSKQYILTFIFFMFM